MKPENRNIRADHDPLTVLTAALWGDMSNDGNGGIDARKLAQRLLDTLAVAGFSLERTESVSEALHDAVPAGRIRELQRLVDRFEVVRSAMREDGRNLRSSAIGVAIGIVQERITELRGGV